MEKLAVTPLNGFEPPFTPLGGVWTVFKSPEGVILGPGIAFGVEAKATCAIIADGHWHEIPLSHGEELRRQAERGAN